MLFSPTLKSAVIDRLSLSCRGTGMGVESPAKLPVCACVWEELWNGSAWAFAIPLDLCGERGAARWEGREVGRPNLGPRIISEHGCC